MSRRDDGRRVKIVSCADSAAAANYSRSASFIMERKTCRGRLHERQPNKMAKIDTVTFCGRSGREYNFRVYSWEHVFKRLPAVYLVMERRIEPQGAPSYSPVYLDITDDLSRIFDSHNKSECFQLYYANTIAVLAGLTQLECQQTAADLTQALDPPCNRQ